MRVGAPLWVECAGEEQVSEVLYHALAGILGTMCKQDGDADIWRCVKAVLGRFGYRQYKHN